MGIRDQYSMVSEDDPGWSAFWRAYPRRCAKKDARKAWMEVSPTAEQVEQIVAALAWQVDQPMWTKDGGAFIPYPASWLRAERWEDEPLRVAAAPVINEPEWARAIRARQKAAS